MAKPIPKEVVDAIQAELKMERCSIASLGPLLFREKGEIGMWHHPSIIRRGGRGGFHTFGGLIGIYCPVAHPLRAGEKLKRDCWYGVWLKDALSIHTANLSEVNDARYIGDDLVTSAVAFAKGLELAFALLPRRLELWEAAARRPGTWFDAYRRKNRQEHLMKQSLNPIRSGCRNGSQRIDELVAEAFRPPSCAAPLPFCVLRAYIAASHGTSQTRYLREDQDRRREPARAFRLYHRHRL